MKRYFIYLCISFIVTTGNQAASPSGSVELDEISFDKIINKFDAALIKFDVAFPYGDKHEAFVALAKDAKDVDELLIGEVGVKDYGDKDNEKLAKKYGATKENFPVVRLFVKGKEPLAFDESKGFTSDELRRFIRDNTGVYLSLPGCVRELDLLAIRFMKHKKDRQIILKEVETVIEDLIKKNNPSTKIYKTIFEKILSVGDEFVKNENERLKKILSGKLSEEKKKEFGVRMNILQTFQNYDKQKGKEEL